MLGKGVYTMKYNYCYKYVKININSIDIIIELSFDNTLGEDMYSAKTNLLFKDENGDYGHACGVGRTEEISLKMCLNEIKQYLNIEDEINDNIELDIPRKITIIHKNKPIILFVKNENEQQIILTKKGRIYIDSNENILDYITKHIKLFIKNGIDNFSKDFFKENNFEPIFDNLFVKI